MQSHWKQDVTDLIASWLSADGLTRDAALRLTLKFKIARKNDGPLAAGTANF